ncbi:DUF4440 domain-containing protein [Wenzhouxiangella sp. XN201]|uniref:YybH family protein n=1 Tax=Wenzhouxiangella sp. XN201 TaxID=2710755 RepID=UPI0013C7D3C3|nr:nuclear transport factor 2 family protein [Wenzhouxiangella sp. XN201]NEZ02553.1 DUF4440 domain-containing protein [Wenzhouxiangella sp. XN201]
MTSKTFVVITGLALLSGCGSPDVDVEAEEKHLMDLSREWSAVAAGDDVEDLMSYWSDDAVMMAPGQPPLRGKEAIREFVTSTGEIPGFSISWEPLEAHVAESGDMGYMIEQNQITIPDSTGDLVTQYNKVITVWEKREDGSWKNVVDMWNSDPSREK